MIITEIVELAKIIPQCKHEKDREDIKKYIDSLMKELPNFNKQAELEERIQRLESKMSFTNR